MSISDFTKEIISLCPDAIIAVNRKGIITIFNDAAEKLCGWTSEEVIGKISISKIYPSLQMAREVKKHLYSPEYGGEGRLEGFESEGVNPRDGRRYPIRLSAVLLYKDGKEVGSVGFFHDLTTRKQLEDELRKLSITDSLTGLYNRRHFYVILGDEVGRSERYNRPLTLIFLDLDHFKSFNDYFGHQQGDGILRLTSECTKKVLRAQDYAFRQGGDEFALVLVETDLENGLLVSERFRNAFNTLWPEIMTKMPAELKPVSLSLGVTEYQPGESIKQLLARADMAMYKAKQKGGNNSFPADESMYRSPWSLDEEE